MSSWISACGDADQATAVARNATAAEILVNSIATDGGSFRLKGRVLSAAPVGGANSMAEPGQEITLTPYYPSGYPDPADSTRAKLAGLARKAPGDTVRCRIMLDQAGAWRILSAD